MSFDSGKLVKLSDISLKITKGTTPSTIGSNFIDRGINFFRSESIGSNKSINLTKVKFIDESTHEKMKRSQLKENDILFSMAGMFLGKTSLVGRTDVPANINQAVALIRLENNSADYKYVYYFLNQKEVVQFINNSSAQSAQPNINLKQIGELPIYLPPILEQKKISSIFSSLDDKIELNNAINKNLEEMAQSLFKRWFGDFEFPNENGEPYKSSGGDFEESELGMIPKGWNVNCLEGIANYTNGLAMQKYRPESENYIPVIKIKELNLGKTSNDSDKASPSLDEKYIVENGDVLFSWSGTLEIKLWCGGTGGLNQHLFKVTSEHYDKWFYYFWTLHYIYKFRRIANDKATTMGHIKRSDLKDAKVIIPDNYFYETATAIFQPIVEKMIQLSIESYNLELVRDSLLPKLMSGEIRGPVEREYTQATDLPMVAENRIKYHANN